jgi:hypothetical protein
MINDLFRKACSDRQTVRDEVKSKKSALEKELTLHFWLASDAKTQENQLRVRPLWCYHVSLNIGRIKILSATCSHLIGRKTRTEAYINSIFFLISSVRKEIRRYCCMLHCFHYATVVPFQRVGMRSLDHVLRSPLYFFCTLLIIIEFENSSILVLSLLSMKMPSLDNSSHYIFKVIDINFFQLSRPLLIFVFSFEKMLSKCENNFEKK